MQEFSSLRDLSLFRFLLQVTLPSYYIIIYYIIVSLVSQKLTRFLHYGGAFS